MKKCENCIHFYECDNTGFYEECLPDMKHYEEKKDKVVINMLSPQTVADWLMNEDGMGSTDEEFLETFKLMEKKIEKRLSDDYTFQDWMKDVVQEIKQKLDRVKSD